CCKSSSVLLDIYGRAVTEHFGDANSDFRGVIANPDDGIGAQLPGVHEHFVERIHPRAFAKRGIEGNVPAEQTLEVRPKITDDRARAHDNAPNHAEGFDHAIPG